MTIATTLGDRLRTVRADAGMTLDGLASASGVSVRAISDIERGVRLRPQTRTVRALADALGLDTHARRWLTGGSDAGPAAASALAPAPLRDFTGRRGELEMLVAGVSGPAPLLVVSGTPGAGKTTLAVEVFRQAAVPMDFYADLRGHGASPATPIEVLSRLLQQADPGAQTPPTLDAAAKRWARICDERHPNVLLDNAHDESQVRPVLASEHLGAVIVTSRRTLAGLTASVRSVLGSMTDLESRALLRGIIPEQQGSTADLDDLAALCNNVPLALRIAGNRIASRPSATVAHFCDRLRRSERRVRLLVAGDLSVEAVFNLSYNDLAPMTAQLFRAVSLGADGTTFAAPMAVAALDGVDRDDVEHRLEELVDLGLLESRDDGRFRLHDLVRQFARERLDEAEGRPAVLARFRSAVLSDLVTATHALLPDRHMTTSMNEAAGIDWVRGEVDHWWPALRGASREGEHRTVVRVATVLREIAPLWLGWAGWSELFTLAAQSARLLGDDRAAAHLHIGVAWAALVEDGDAAAAATAVTAAERHAMRSADPGVQAAVVSARATVLLARGERDAAAQELAAPRSPDALFDAVTVLARLHQVDGHHEPVLELLQASDPGRRVSAVDADRRSLRLEVLAASVTALRADPIALVDELDTLALHPVPDTTRARAVVVAAEVSGRPVDRADAARVLDPERTDAVARDLLERLTAVTRVH